MSTLQDLEAKHEELRREVAALRRIVTKEHEARLLTLEDAWKEVRTDIASLRREVSSAAAQVGRLTDIVAPHDLLLHRIGAGIERIERHLLKETP